MKRFNCFETSLQIAGKNVDLGPMCEEIHFEFPKPKIHNIEIKEDTIKVTLKNSRIESFEVFKDFESGKFLLNLVNTQGSAPIDIKCSFDED